MYFVIIISNKGNPTFGALLSSFPIGILGLLAINKKNQETFITSAVFVNLIIFIMWIIVWTIYKYFSKKFIFALYYWIFVMGNIMYILLLYS